MHDAPRAVHVDAVHRHEAAVQDVDGVSASCQILRASRLNAGSSAALACTAILARDVGVGNARPGTASSFCLARCSASCSVIDTGGRPAGASGWTSSGRRRRLRPARRR